MITPPPQSATRPDVNVGDDEGENNVETITKTMRLGRNMASSMSSTVAGQANKVIIDGALLPFL